MLKMKLFSADHLIFIPTKHVPNLVAVEDNK